MRVTDAIGDWFAARGIRHYFGYCGATAIPLLDGLVPHPEIVGIQPKHESHAVHMADMYFKATGRIAPVIVTKGPGIMNCLGGLATALHDSSSLMLLAGGTPTHHFGKSMQELSQHGFEDVVSVVRPVVKRAWLQIRPDTMLDTLNQAYKIATTGRPGPVFVYIPLDILLAEVETSNGGVRVPRAVTSKLRPDEESIAKVVHLLDEAERPLIVAGGGVALSPGGAEALQAFVEATNVPVVTTLTAKGVISEEHPLSLGPVGRSGSTAAASAARQADVVLAFGARFSDNNTSNWRAGKVYDVPRTKIVQVDIDVAEIGRTYPPEVGILGDVETVLRDVLAATARRDAGRRQPWLDEIAGLRKAWVEEIAPAISSDATPLHPARIMHDVSEAIAERGRVLIDIGDAVSYAEAYMTIRRPGSWFIWPGFAEMGSAASGVLGAVVADPSQPAIAVTGDGAMNMVSQIIGAAVEYDLPAIWVILNNAELGIERKAMDLLYGRQHPWGTFVRADTGEPYNPDYVKLAEAWGATGERVESAGDLRAALRRAIEARRPYLIDVPCDTTPPTYFTTGIERSYPNKWAETYPQYMDLQIVKK
jgi:acetolactate synthase I/II/III large subunit